jgi:hypothetical protein
MKFSLSVLLILSGLSALAATSSEKSFAGLRCDADIAKALIGRQMENVPVQEIEKKYQRLHLQDMGAEEITNQWSLITWKICDRFFMLLEKGDQVTDVIELPRIKDKEIPVLLACKVARRELQYVLPVIKNNKILTAWQVDLNAQKINPLATANLSCP